MTVGRRVAGVSSKLLQVLLSFVRASKSALLGLRNICVNLIYVRLNLCSSKWISVCVHKYNLAQHSSTRVPWNPSIPQNVVGLREF